MRERDGSEGVKILFNDDLHSDHSDYHQTMLRMIMKLDDIFTEPSIEREMSQLWTPLLSSAAGTSSSSDTSFFVVKPPNPDHSMYELNRQRSEMMNNESVATRSTSVMLREGSKNHKNLNLTYLQSKPQKSERKYTTGYWLSDFNFCEFFEPSLIQKSLESRLWRRVWDWRR